MRLTLTTDDGVVLDTATITPADFVAEVRLAPNGLLAQLEPGADALTCGAELAGYRCTLRAHGPRIDHADQVIAPGGIRAASYTRAFWKDGATEPNIADPYAGRHTCDLRTDGAGDVYRTTRAACPVCPEED